MYCTELDMEWYLLENSDIYDEKVKDKVIVDKLFCPLHTCQCNT